MTKAAYLVIIPIKQIGIIGENMILSRQLPEGVSYDFAAVKLCDNDF